MASNKAASNGTAESPPEEVRDANATTTKKRTSWGENALKRLSVGNTRRSQSGPPAARKSFTESAEKTEAAYSNPQTEEGGQSSSAANAPQPSLAELKVEFGWKENYGIGVSKAEGERRRTEAEARAIEVLAKRDVGTSQADSPPDDDMAEPVRESEFIRESMFSDATDFEPEEVMHAMSRESQISKGHIFSQPQEKTYAEFKEEFGWQENYGIGVSKSEGDQRRATAETQAQDATAKQQEVGVPFRISRSTAVLDKCLLLPRPRPSSNSRMQHQLSTIPWRVQATRSVPVLGFRNPRAPQSRNAPPGRDVVPHRNGSRLAAAGLVRGEATRGLGQRAERGGPGQLV